MKHPHISKGFIAVAAVVMLAGCATKPAPDIGGRWKPVNRFASTTMEIPLYTSYVYQATPMDGTLKTMLERWAKDSGMTLDYRISSDYTLYGVVSTISTTNPQQAVIDLSSAYSAQGVSVSIVGNQIVVQSVASSVSQVGADASHGS
ncbi:MULTISPECIES: toxin co-regulated pilus biosynthesis Q family protein [unclassified Stenotrophomonas]|uniref:toxin co-regulated pilus biosynthesis Q family protein n=1 Tax=unclassified Stenotrophomonas TaxID=196198 RepID=UPI0021175264|nr:MULTISPECIES: toxin co-regulated pilus biosynthesis Q family protein [unclassified Stenotrophomonas]